MNDKQAKHTPLPWSTLWDEYGRYEIWGDTVDDFVAERVEKKNAQFIILSCNSHYRLVEALKNLYMEIRGYNPTDIDLSEAEKALRAAGVEL